MRKINYKKIAIHSVLWVLLMFFCYLVIDMLYINPSVYIKPLARTENSFLNGVYISVFYTVFYVGLIKVVRWMIECFDWLLKKYVK